MSAEPMTSDRPKAGWSERVAEYEAFTRTHRRHPSQMLDAEANLYWWMRKQVKLGRDGALGAAQLRVLDRLVPGWRRTSKDAAAARIDALVVVLDGLDELPPPREAEELHVELRAARSRLASGTLEAEQIERLDRANPDWRGITVEPDSEHDAFEAHWRERLAELATFTAAHGRLPAPKAADEDERTIARWHRLQVRVADGTAPGRWSPEREQALDAAVPSWRPERDRWVVACRREVSRLDGGGRQASNARAWLGRQREALEVGRLAESHAALLDTLRPGWRSAPVDAWEARLREVAATISAAGGAIPPVNTTEGFWVYRQRTRADDLSAERVALLDALLPGWTRPPARAQRAKAGRSQLQRFLLEHHRPPSPLADDELEARLGQRLVRRITRAWRDSDVMASLDAEVPGWRLLFAVAPTSGERPAGT